MWSAGGLVAACPMTSIDQGDLNSVAHLKPHNRHLRQADTAGAPTHKGHAGAVLRNQSSSDIIRLHAIGGGKCLESHALASIDGGFKGSVVELGAVRGLVRLHSDHHCVCSFLELT
ncbi:MAG: hypothetical protein ACK55I_33145 [bacterium]